MESNAVLLKFWRPQPNLPCFGLQYSISKKTRTTVSLSSMQVVFAESSLRKQAWRNPKEGRVGCLHQNIFTRKVTDIAFTSDFCNNYSYTASPASLYLTSPRPRPTRAHVPHLMSSSPSSRVAKSQVPTHASRCPRPRPTFIHSRQLVNTELENQPSSHLTKHSSPARLKKLSSSKELAWNLYTV